MKPLLKQVLLLLTALVWIAFVTPVAILATAYGEGKYGDWLYGAKSLSSSGPESCLDTVPGSSPWLYAATAKSGNSIRIYFTQAKDPVTHYVLQFGEKTGEYIYGAENIGGKDTNSFLVESLSPNTTYYFRVRAGNGCTVGEWSNEISTRTFGGGYFEKFVPDKLETEIVDLETVEREAEVEDTEGYSVQVKVIDKEEKPVEGATVEIHSDIQSVKTDKDGIARFENVAPGDHKILISYNGQKGEQNVNLTGDTVKEFRFTVQITPTSPFKDSRVLGVLGGLGLITFFLLVRQYRLKK